jgi:hypothetical protein
VGRVVSRSSLQVQSLGMEAPSLHLASCVRRNLFYDVAFKDAIQRQGMLPRKHLAEFICSLNGCVTLVSGKSS